MIEELVNSKAREGVESMMVLIKSAFFSGRLDECTYEEFLKEHEDLILATLLQNATVFAELGSYATPKTSLN